LHAPEFWKWIIAPGIIFLLELTYRMLTSLMGKGKASIMAGVVLPSRVTNLIVKRPHNFSFAPGDWVFVKIPAIAKSEWHPFTISSAPEQQDIFTLHIRGVGEWTNRLYSYFEEEYRRQQEGKEEAQPVIDRLRG
jgi:predicted ferric reductase